MQPRRSFQSTVEMLESSPELLPPEHGRLSEPRDWSIALGSDDGGLGVLNGHRKGEALELDGEWFGDAVPPQVWKQTYAIIDDVLSSFQTEEIEVFRKSRTLIEASSCSIALQETPTAVATTTLAEEACLLSTTNQAKPVVIEKRLGGHLSKTAPRRTDNAVYPLVIPSLNLNSKTGIFL